MAQELGTGYIIISPSTKGLGKAIEGSIDQGTTSGTEKSSKTLLQRVGGAFGKIGKIGVAATTAVGGAIVGLAAKGGYDRALNIERAQTKLKALGHDTKSIDGIMNNALASVKGTAFGLGDAASVAAQLVASGLGQGAELEGALKSVGDAAQVAGVEFSDMGTIFAKVAATGHLQGDEMAQLMEAGIPVLQNLAKHYGITADEARDMVSKGKVSFKDFQAAMDESIGGAAQRAGESFDGAMANIKAALSRVGEGFGTPLLNGATTLLNKLIPVVDKTAAAFKPLQAEFGAKFTKLVDTAGKYIDVFSAKLDNGEITIQSLAQQIGLLVGGFGTLATIGPYAGTFIDTISSMADSTDSGISKTVTTIKSLPDKLKAVFDGGLATFDRYSILFHKSTRDLIAMEGSDPFAPAVQRIANGFSTISDTLKTGANKISNTKLGSTIGTVFDRMKIGVSSGTGKVKNAITEKMAGLAFAFENNPVVNATKSMTDKISSGLSATGSKITSWGSNLGSKVKSAFTPVGEILGGFGDMIGPKLKGGLDRVGGMLSTFFSPGNFMKFLGIGAIIAALVAGLGMLNESMGGKLAELGPRMMSALSTITPQIMSFLQTQLPGLMESGGQIILSILNGITQSLPSLAVVASTLVSTLVTGLAAQLPQLIPSAALMIVTLVTALIDQIPILLDSGMQLLQGLVEGLVAALPILIAAVPQIIDSLITTLATSLPQILQQGTNILNSLVNGLIKALPLLVAMVPQIISTIVNGLVSNLPRIIQSGMQLLNSLINGLVKALPQLISYVPQIIASIVSTLASNLPQIIQAGVQILVMLIRGLVQAIPQLVAAIPQCVSAIKNGFSSVNWGEVGMAIINGIKDGVAAAAKSLWQAASDAVGGAINWVKSKFGIHSPSTVFRDKVGRFLGEGIARGITDSARDVALASERAIEEAIPSKIPMPGLDVKNWNASLTKFTVPQLSASVKPVGSYDYENMGISGFNKQVTYNITINGNQVDMDARIQNALTELVDACGVTMRGRA